MSTHVYNFLEKVYIHDMKFGFSDKDVYHSILFQQSAVYGITTY